MKKVLLLSLLSLIFIPAVLQAASEVKLLDQWYLLLLGGKQVGYSHQLTFKDEQGRFRSEIYERLAVKRLGESFMISRRDLWLEKETFISLISEINMNGQLRRFTAEAQTEGIRIVMESDSSAKKVEKLLPASDEVLGIFQAQQRIADVLADTGVSTGCDLLADPPAQVCGRDLAQKYLFLSPETMSLEEVSVEIKGFGELTDSQGNLYRGIIAEERISPYPAATLIVDKGGRILYSQMSLGLPVEVILLKEPPGEEEFAEARDFSELTELALLDVASLGIPIAGLADLSGREAQLTSALIRFRGSGIEQLLRGMAAAAGDLGIRSKNFDSTVRNSAGKEQGAEILIRAAEEIRHVKPAADSHALPEVAAGVYIEDGFHLSLENPLLEPLLAGCLMEERLDVECLRSLVYSFISNKSTRYAFADVDKILETREGDCTEHSLLLVNLLRVLKIPARIAYGFVLMDNGFIGHAWSELYYGGHWYWLDPSFPAAESRRLKLRLGTIDPAQPVYSQLDIALLIIGGGLKGEIVEWSFD